MPLYVFLHSLLNVLEQIANKMWLQKKIRNSHLSYVYVVGEYTINAEVLNSGDSGFSEMAPDKSTSQEVTSVSAVSTHSSKKSDDGGYVQVITVLKGFSSVSATLIL
jgi:hypothetical protein